MAKNKSQRRTEAQQRQAEYDELKLGVKIAKALIAPGKSKKQLRRLAREADAQSVKFTAHKV